MKGHSGKFAEAVGWGIFYEKMSAAHSKEASFLYIRGVLD